MDDINKVKEDIDYFQYDKALIEKYLQNLNLEQLEQLKNLKEKNNEFLNEEINRMVEEKND